MKKNIELFERNLKRLGFKNFEEHQVDNEGNKCFISCNDKSSVLCTYKLPSGHEFKKIKNFKGDDHNKLWDLLMENKKQEGVEIGSSYKKNITDFYNLIRGVETILKAHDRSNRIELRSIEDKDHIQIISANYDPVHDDIEYNISLDAPFWSSSKTGRAGVDVRLLKMILNNHPWMESIDLKFVDDQKALFINIHGRGIVAEFLIAPLRKIEY
jgi:hypothetical protein